MPKPPQIPFTVDAASNVEKYRQIVEGVTSAIRAGKLGRHDPLPSVSALGREFGLARETVIKAYAVLQTRGLVHAVPRKGYFVATESVAHQANVMLLFDELPAYKQTVYDSFMAALAGKAQVDVFFHHCNPGLFERLLLDNLRHYDLAVVMPFADPAVGRTLKQVDPEKILILDRLEHTGGRFSFIAQEFEESVFNCLQQAVGLLKKYRRFYLVFPPAVAGALKSSQAPREIIAGFNRFCRLQKMTHGVLHDLKAHPAKKGDALLVIDDLDLVHAVEMARENHLAIGSELGLIAYNDSPMKRVIDRGITVISANFAEEGRLAAQHVLHRKPVRKLLTTALVRRHSL